jgi:hypothetical protein
MAVAAVTVRRIARSRNNSRHTRHSTTFVAHMIQQTHFTEIIVLLANCCVPEPVASAQDNSAAPGVDAPLRKDVDPVLKPRYTRQAENAFVASATPDNPEWAEPTRMQHWINAGNWTAIGEFRKQFEPSAAERIHTKTCSDLAYEPPARGTVEVSDLSPDRACLGRFRASPLHRMCSNQEVRRPETDWGEPGGGDFHGSPWLRTHGPGPLRLLLAATPHWKVCSLYRPLSGWNVPELAKGVVCTPRPSQAQGRAPRYRNPVNRQPTFLESKKQQARSAVPSGDFGDCTGPEFARPDHGRRDRATGRS